MRIVDNELVESTLVSTLIPVFNRATMLREAVASVLAQTYRPVEIVIIDDGSSDDTPRVADELSHVHAEIKVIHQANEGPGAAREAGRRIARGEFIQHLDSDDVLEPRKFELQVTQLNAHPECGAAYGWTRFRRRDGSVQPTPWKRSGERMETIFPSMLTMRWWDTPTPLYRASILAKAGPWTDLRVEEDWEYDCRLGALGVRLCHVDDWVCEVREHANPYTAPAALRDRARAHLLMYEHAQTASLDPASPEMRFFARDLFHLARQCGAADLANEARRLVTAARAIHDTPDLRGFALFARAFGWRRAALTAAWFKR